MQKLVIVILLFGFSITSDLLALPFNPRVGDLILQNLNSSFASGVSGATKSPWAHVGIVDSNDNNFVVLEASFGGVVATPLKRYLERCKQRYAVVRLKFSRKVIHSVVERSRTHLGKPYDYTFKLNEINKLYCSELIYDALQWVLKSNNPVQPSPMDFSGALSYWEKYFKRHNSPIPQGELGVSPNDIFVMPKAEVVYKYKFPTDRFEVMYQGF